MARVLAVLVTLAVALFPVAGWAQGLSDSQLKLNEEAVQRGAEGDFEAAIKLLRASLELGEFDITYLNLGRVLSKAGRCEEALAAYNAIDGSKRVGTPTREQILEARDGFRNDLQKTCDGTLAVTCPGNATVTVDGTPHECSESLTLTLAPGDHEVTAGDTTQKVSIVGMQTSNLVLAAGGIKSNDSDPTPDPDPTPKPADDGLSTQALTGWITLSGGAALLATALILDVAVITPGVDEVKDLQTMNDRTAFEDRRDEVSSLQTTNLILMGVGVAAAATGTVLIIFDSGSSNESASASTWIAPWALPEGAGAAMGTRF